MQDIQGQISALKRPPLLVRAARFGVDDYCRSRHLPRFIDKNPLPNPGQALVLLLDLEKSMNAERVARTGGYSVAKHIQVLVALMAEAQLFQATRTHTLRIVPS